MIIVVNCPGCRKRYELDGVLAGKKSRCRGCGEVFRIPVPTARAVEPTAPPPPATPSSWTAAPLAELLDGEPAEPGPAPAPRPLRRDPAPIVAVPPRGSARPASKPSSFDDDLPPPPRAGYRSEPRRRSSSRSDDGDCDLGVSSFGWYMLFSLLTTIVMLAYLSLATIDVNRFAIVYSLGASLILIVGGGLAMWGSLWLIGLSFREDTITGVLCLFIPGYFLYFIGSRWSERRGLLALLFSPWLGFALNFGLLWVFGGLIRENINSSGSGTAAEAPQVVDNPQPAPASPPAGGSGFPEVHPGPPPPEPFQTQPAWPRQAGPVGPRFGPRMSGGFRRGMPPPVQGGPPVAATITTPSPAPDEVEPDIPAGADAVTRSMIELKSGNGHRRRQALDRLQRCEPDGRVDQVLEVLLPLLEGDDGFQVAEVVKTLAVWRSPEAMQGLIGRLRDNRFFVRNEAIKSLGHYREPRAAEALVPLMKQERFAVEEALKSMGEVAEPALIPMLRNPDSGQRGQACRILAQVGGQATLKEMQSLPPDPDLGVRMAASDAWKQIVARVGPPPRAPRGKAGTGR